MIKMPSQFRPIHLIDLKTYLDHDYPIIFCYYDEEMFKEIKEEYKDRYSFHKSKDFSNIIEIYKIT